VVAGVVSYVLLCYFKCQRKCAVQIFLFSCLLLLKIINCNTNKPNVMAALCIKCTLHFI